MASGSATENRIGIDVAASEVIGVNHSRFAKGNPRKINHPVDVCKDDRDRTHSAIVARSKKMNDDGRNLENHDG